jgi:hypothetical protein
MVTNINCYFMREGMSEASIHEVNKMRRIDISELKDQRGRIGKQGFTMEGVIGIFDHLGIKFSPETSLSEALETIRQNPDHQKTFQNFLEQNPIKISHLPDGTYHLDDGHHRAFIADQVGMKSVPIVLRT